jgi:hypothetical protein
MSNATHSPPPNDADRSDAITLQYQPSGRAARRLVFEPRDAGGYECIEQVWSGCGYWRDVGGEPVERVTIDDGDVEQAGCDRERLIAAAERLASQQYSIETQARIETLLWALGYLDTGECPSGAADDQRVREVTNRGPWPFDPDLGGESDDN